MESTNKKRKADVEILADLSFFVFLFTTFTFSHSIIGQLGVAFFLFAVHLLMLLKRRIHYSYYFLFSIIFIIYNYYLIRSGIAINVPTSMAMTGTLVINCLFAFALYNYLIIEDDFPHTLRLYLVASWLFSIFILILSGSAIFNSRLGIGVNITVAGMSVEYNANLTATICSIAYFVGLYEYLSEKRKRYFIACLWFTLLILLTGSRKGVLTIFLGTALMVFLLRPKKITRNVFISALSIFLVYIAMMDIPALYEIAGSRFKILFDFIHGNQIEEASMLSRLGMIQRGWQYFLMRPWNGYGLDCYRLLEYSHNTYSHNNYIELLVSGGIIGFILYYIPNVIMYLKIFRNAFRANDITKVIFVMFIVQQAMEYASVTYFERIPLFILIFALAALKVMSKKYKRKKLIE